MSIQDGFAYVSFKLALAANAVSNSYGMPVRSKFRVRVGDSD